MRSSTTMAIAAAVSVLVASFIFAQSQSYGGTTSTENALCGMKPVQPMGFKKADAECLCLDNPPKRATCKWFWSKKQEEKTASHKAYKSHTHHSRSSEHIKKTDE